MRKSIMLLMLILTVGIGSALATTKDSGGGNDGTKIELVNKSSVKVDPAVKHDFNLNVDLVRALIRPSCTDAVGHPVVPESPTDSNYGTQTKIYEQTTPNGDTFQTWSFECTRFNGDCPTGCAETRSYVVVIHA